MKIYPVIMCGGSGTRLWPLSLPERPKQFIPLIAERSSFQYTIQRLAAIRDAAPPLVIAGLAHADWIRLNLAAIGAKADILLEPEPRDSAAAVAAAAAWVAARDPDGVAAIVAADHHVPDFEAFARAIETAAGAAADGWIVTLGVRPDSPAIAYGYIAPAEAIAAGPVSAVSRFVEKPDLERAKTYVESGYLWNSGNFIARASILQTAFAAFAPAVGDAARLGVETAEATPAGAVLGAAFLQAPKISFDYAVMEKADRVAVLPVGFAWSDLGAWDAIWAASPRDAQGNAIQGEGRLIDVSNSLLRRTGAHGPAITVLGLSNIAVVGDDQNLLIANLAASQGVKLAAQMAAPVLPPPRGRLSRHSERYDRWLRTAALPLWWSVGADGDGGYHDLIDQDGRPLAATKRARVQARQSFVYAQALKMELPGVWRSAAEHGLAYMRSHFRRPDGLYRTSLDAAGAPLDEDAYLYDQAFFLMALATLAGIEAAPAPLLAEAESLLTAIEQAMTHPAGGFREAGAHPFQANCHMHLLEAALAWVEVGGGDRWRTLAGRIVDLALRRFIDPDHGFLREFFDAAWAPEAGEGGRLVEPGHQFEWAWLMARWARLSATPEPLAAARRLFQAGTRGIDIRRGVAIDELHEIEQIRSARARLWPQTEYLKAALILAVDDDASGDGGYLAHAARAADGLWRYLETPVAGLWWDKMLEDSSFIDEPAPASSLYHIIGAVCALKVHKTGGV